VNLPVGSTVKVLIPFTDPVIVGKFVFHCHIVAHEDLVTARQLITGFRKMSGDGFRNSNPRETCCV
jgi:FtsP/CotA-like multicopper oxidase with cupredoxin domain